MGIFTAAEALEIAMEIEKNGEVFYKAVAAKATDAGVKALFEELAHQEQKHYAIFRKMAGNVIDTPDLPASDYDEYRVYLKATLDNALFAGPDKALDMAKRATDQRAALQAAVGFEKDTLLFFYDLREMVNPADQQLVGDIIREEKSHLHRLAKML